MKKLEEVESQIIRGGEPSNNGSEILADLANRTMNELYPGSLKYTR